MSAGTACVGASKDERASEWSWERVTRCYEHAGREAADAAVPGCLRKCCEREVSPGGGESPNMSSSEVDVLSEVLFPDVLNRNGGALLSGVGRFIPSWKDAALLLARLGRRNPGRRLLQTVRQRAHKIASCFLTQSARWEPPWATLVEG